MPACLCLRISLPLLPFLPPCRDILPTIPIPRFLPALPHCISSCALLVPFSTCIPTLFCSCHLAFLLPGLLSVSVPYLPTHLHTYHLPMPPPASLQVLVPATMPAYTRVPVPSYFYRCTPWFTPPMPFYLPQHCLLLPAHWDSTTALPSFTWVLLPATHMPPPPHVCTYLLYNFLLSLFSLLVSTIILAFTTCSFCCPIILYYRTLFYLWVHIPQFTCPPPPTTVLFQFAVLYSCIPVMVWVPTYLQFHGMPVPTLPFITPPPFPTITTFPSLACCLELAFLSLGSLLFVPPHLCLPCAFSLLPPGSY